MAQNDAIKDLLESEQAPDYPAEKGVFTYFTYFTHPSDTANGG
jgi:hypothetical protein